MNNFLSEFGSKLQDEFDVQVGPKITTRQHNVTPNNLIYTITPRDVQEALNNLDTNKCSGLNTFLTFILKDTFGCLLPHVSYLMNQSLKTVIFLDKWAIATVIPIPKSGDLSKVSSWRPISILPLPRKILEKFCIKCLLGELSSLGSHNLSQASLLLLVNPRHKPSYKKS